MVILVENHDFFMPLAFDAPVKGVPVGLLSYRLVRKNRMVWLLDGGKCLKICFAVSTEYRRVTDERTDRQLATA